MSRTEYVDDGLELDGLRVELWRSAIDGRLVVQVTNEPGGEGMDTNDLADGDVPRFRLIVNEDDAYSCPEGEANP